MRKLIREAIKKEITKNKETIVESTDDFPQLRSKNETIKMATRLIGIITSSAIHDDWPAANAASNELIGIIEDLHLQSYIILHKLIEAQSDSD